MSGDIVVTPGVGDMNLSPDAFHRMAAHFYKARQDFASPDGFSPLPYFLLCRAIELEIKARHLVDSTQATVKKDFWHDIETAYSALPEAYRILTDQEQKALGQASAIYLEKGFEYFVPRDALTAYKRFPDLQLLDDIASKLVSAGDEFIRKFIASFN